jgi:hypothetical protein
VRHHTNSLNFKETKITKAHGIYKKKDMIFFWLHHKRFFAILFLCFHRKDSTIAFKFKKKFRVTNPPHLPNNKNLVHPLTVPEYSVFCQKNVFFFQQKLYIFCEKKV